MSPRHPAMSPLGQVALAMAVVVLVEPTGQTKMEWAQRYHLYRCAAGHQEWILADPGPRVDQVVVSDPCPSCGRQLRWTGQVNGFGEHATKVFACEAGHSVLRRR